MKAPMKAQNESFLEHRESSTVKVSKQYCNSLQKG
jgi:hypothetical protein